jgi:ubiquinone/menaquinone biosynthesis C-methylase UbiE
VSEGDAFDYEAARWGEETIEPGERSIAGFRLAEALRLLPSHGRVLEVGCGAGRFLRAVSEARPELALTGVDVSRSALATLARLAPAIETRVAAPARLPARDAEFDAVLMLDVLEHVDDPAGMLAEIRRVLAPGGVLHAHVPCDGDPRSLWRWLPGQSGARAWKRRFGGHIQRFRRRELLALIEATGFEIVRERGSLHFIGAAADVAAFAGLALAAHRGRRTTTGEILASARAPGPGVAARLSAALVRGVDGLLWAEATLLGRMPSWAVHVTARKRG